MDVILVFCMIFLDDLACFWTLTILHTLIYPASFWIPTLRLTLIYPASFWTPRNILLFLPDWICWVKMSKKCCVPNCNKRRADNTILHFFPHPWKETERFNAWKNAIGGPIVSLSPETIFKCRRVCHHHFEEQYYTRSKRLSPNAVPTLYLSATTHASIERQPMQDITQRVTSDSNAMPISRPPQSFVQSTVMHPTIETAHQPSTSYASPPKDVRSKKKPPIVVTDIAALGSKIRRLQKAKDTAVKKLRKFMTLSENPVFQKALKNFTSTALIFTMLQFREAGKTMVGRRFNKKEKLMSLAFYKQGPRAYRWMRKFCVLPSPLTLNRMIRKAALKPGVNENIFKQFKNVTKKMKKKEKLCIVMFDEISLTPNLNYNKRNDNITGFADSGLNKKKKIADHALVFMVRGIHKNYKQPLLYSFCSKTTPKDELVQIIKMTIRNLINVGFDVVATICDQSATNVSAINYLINERKTKLAAQNQELRYSTFEIDGHEIIPLYDPPHLIKCIRNNLLNKDIICEMKGNLVTGKWEHIIKLYHCDAPVEGLKLVPKLTDRHIIPEKMYKMKVKCATQVLSSTVALHMGMMTKCGSLPKECLETAKIIAFFDKLFDSFNGSYNKFQEKTGKPLLGPVTKNSIHHEVWTEAKPILNSMRYLKNGKSISVPTIRHWLMTVENAQYMIAKLSEKYDLTSVWMRHFNQDPLENFFGCVRSHGYRNTSPTCAGFEAAFTALLVNNISNSHSPGANCEKDSCRVFKSLKVIFFGPTETSNHISELDYEDIINFDFVDVEKKMKNTKIKAQLEYVSGYVLRKIKRKIFKNCKQCEKDFYSERKEDSTIIAREYFKNKFCLTYPNINIVKCFSNMQDLILNIIRKDCIKNNLKAYIKIMLSVLMNYNFISCAQHKKDFINEIENITIDFFIRNWCKDCNKLLNGSRSEYEENDNIQMLCANYRKNKK